MRVLRREKALYYQVSLAAALHVCALLISVISCNVSL